MAELLARTAAAEEALASSRQRLHDLHRQSTSPHTPPKSPRSGHGSPRVRSPSPPSDFAALLQLSNTLQQQAAGQRREDEQQRSEDEQRRADQRSEERSEAAELEARIDARQATHAPPANSSSLSSDPGFTSNKSFARVPLFSGESEQPFNPWTVEILAPAEGVGDAHDNLRELRLKLQDPSGVRSYLNRRYRQQRYARPDLSPRTVLRCRYPAVHNEAEDHYSVLEWSLTGVTAAQRTLFLSQLSAGRDASDACLKRPHRRLGRVQQLLVCAGTGFLGRAHPVVQGSRGAHRGVPSPRARQGCGRTRRDGAGCDHDRDTRRPRRRSRPCSATTILGPNGRGAAPVRLKTQHTTRGAAADKPPPRYYGTAE